MATTSQPAFQHRSCYINFAGHLLNAYNPNMLHPKLPYRWSDADWISFIGMLAEFGFNVFEFWLEPHFFCREGLRSAYGRELVRQLQKVIDHGRQKGVAVNLVCALTTVGQDWHTHCPNVPEEWREVRQLWAEWLGRFAGLGMVSIFPGDPGGCSRTGCTAETFIDKSLEIVDLVKQHQPQAAIQLGTWGNPFFGWGSIKGPPGWNGEFLTSIQGSAWEFDPQRAERAMRHLLRRLPDFPRDTLVAINMGFNPDGDPETSDPTRNPYHPAQDARPWAREIAKTHRILTWDFSLTEGENAIMPHYRFSRLYTQRQRELAAAPYAGGICFSMTPRLNQLSLCQAATSFLNPAAEAAAVTRQFYRRLFGPGGEALAEVLPIFEVYPDWGNYEQMRISKSEFHRTAARGAEILHTCQASVNHGIAFFPEPEVYRRELLFFMEWFRDASGSAPDYAALQKSYWQRVYAIYDQLPAHVDPRPVANTRRLVEFFKRGQW